MKTGKTKAPERIAALRKLMAERQIDAYLVPTDDFHGSEYVGEYFKSREYLSGFTGSAGTLLVTKKRSGLWTDGRYFIQAERELFESGIELFRMGMPGVPSLEEFLADRMPMQGTLGFDGRTVTEAAAERIQKALAEKQVRFQSREDLVGLIWADRPPLPAESAWLLDDAFAGKTREAKLAELRSAMTEKRILASVISSLDDIAWLLNFRGNDTACTPVVLCYAIVTLSDVFLFTDENKFSEKDRKQLESAGVRFCPYHAVCDFLREEAGALFPEKVPIVMDSDTGKAEQRILLDPQKCSYELAAALREGLHRIGREDAVICRDRDLTLLPKAVKNRTEIENMRLTHEKDGAAVTRMIFRLKRGKTGKKRMTELDVAAQIEELRKQQEGYLEPSFETIAAYAENGAVIHYTADENGNREILRKGFLLLDTGGTYFGGTTDVTRTIALGELTEEEKRCYTAVLKGNLALGAAVFPKGTRGIQLDALARRPIWELGLDYLHGTGHGVGFMLSVHEGPNSIRNRVSDHIEESAVLLPGMITSNEPGIYLENRFGIRLETLLLCRPAEQEGMLSFETLTLVPFDREAILPELLTSEEKERLNAYHERVFCQLLPLLSEEEALWLRKETLPIGE